MQIIMPKLGLTMTHGTSTAWLKSPGDAVKAEEALCAYETEKVTLELTAPEDGVLAEILAPAGTTVAAGTPVCGFRMKNEGRESYETLREDVTIVAIGGMLPKALAAAERLASQGIQAEVVDPRTLVPLDTATILASVRKTSRVLIAYEAHKRLGPGAEIAALIAEEGIGYLDGPIVRVAARNVPLPYSPELENFVLPSVQDIVDQAEKLVRGAL